MVDQFHEFKLSVRPLGMCHILEGSGQLLNCNILLGHCVIRSTHDTLKKKIRQITVIKLSVRSVVIKILGINVKKTADCSLIH